MTAVGCGGPPALSEAGCPARQLLAAVQHVRDQLAVAAKWGARHLNGRSQYRNKMRAQRPNTPHASACRRKVDPQAIYDVRLPAVGERLDQMTGISGASTFVAVRRAMPYETLRVVDFDTEDPEAREFAGGRTGEFSSTHVASRRRGHPSNLWVTGLVPSYRCRRCRGPRSGGGKRRNSPTYGDATSPTRFHRPGSRISRPPKTRYRPSPLAPVLIGSLPKGVRTLWRTNWLDLPQLLLTDPRGPALAL
jgi:hypothetical protein